MTASLTESQTSSPPRGIERIRLVVVSMPGDAESDRLSTSAGSRPRASSRSTPVIRDAQNKSLREISEAVKDLANRARNKLMKPEEFQGGSFTVSNLGGMGIDSFSAVINPPQGFILAVGKVNKVPVIDDGDQIVVGQRMSITMSCDHRVVDGALGAEFLKELRHLLENPALLLV